LMMATLDSEQTMLSQCRAFIELFHEGIGSKVVAIGGGDSRNGMPSITRAKGGDKSKERKRKVPETRSSRKKRKIQSKR
jgi:hypothetical protein